MYCVTQYKHSVRRILGYIDIFSALFIICLNVFTEHCSHLRNTVIGIQRVGFVLCVQASRRNTCFIVDNTSKADLIILF